HSANASDPEEVPDQDRRPAQLGRAHVRVVAASALTTLTLRPSRRHGTIPQVSPTSQKSKKSPAKPRKTKAADPDRHDVIRVHGARVNNLKDVSVEIPKRRLTAFTGVSGSGKSSLVFGTIAAESQRLINETYSAFVQGFMPTL